jgi:hypothetical protein
MAGAVDPDRGGMEAARRHFLAAAMGGIGSCRLVVARRRLACLNRCRHGLMVLMALHRRHFRPGCNRQHRAGRLERCERESKDGQEADNPMHGKNPM